MSVSCMSMTFSQPQIQFLNSTKTSTSSVCEIFSFFWGVLLKLNKTQTFFRNRELDEGRQASLSKTQNSIIIKQNFGRITKFTRYHRHATFKQFS